MRLSFYPATAAPFDSQCQKGARRAKPAHAGDEMSDEQRGSVYIQVKHD
jgi:hypothetical protein